MEKLTYKSPDPFDFDRDNICAAWKTLRQRFSLSMKATESAAKANDVKVAILLTVLGERGVDIYNNFTSAEASGMEWEADYVLTENKDNYGLVIGKLDDHCNKRDPVVALWA